MIPLLYVKNIKAIILLLILFLSACTSSDKYEDIDNQSSLRFSFDSKIWGVNTRGTDLSDKNLNSMVVFGNYSGLNKFENQLLNRITLFDNDLIYKTESGFWSYDLPRYWFVEGYHHFFAFAPSGDLHVYYENVDKYPVIDYQVPDRGIEQKDILWSFGELINRVYKKDESNDVNFVMHHALSRISFSGALANNNIINDKIKIVKIAMKNLYQKGQSRFYFSETSIIDGSWDIDPTLISDFTALESTENEANELKKDLWLTTELQNIFTENGAFFMMPQSFSGRPVDAMPLIEVTFNRQSDNKNIVQKFNLNSPVEVPGISGWNPGQAINYQLTYTGDNESPFQINAAVIPWDTQNVDLNIEGTYLNISENNVSLSSMSGGLIHFSTDGSSVQLTSIPSISLIVEFDEVMQEGAIKISQGIPVGRYILNLKSGVLERSIVLTIK